MGPLVPYIISNEFSLVVALLLGIGFGFALEQAGFSSTKKLVGLFYGYDFTVLKVFFTAGVTAMIGVLLLAHWGLLDLSMIYINPTFLWSALVGGAIMGLGFVIGGFCPGTSVCAAAIGKIDGMAFVGGTVLGVLVFAEAYPWFEHIYTSANWGGVLINDKLGMSRIVFAFLLTAIALAAFYFTGMIEDKVNGTKQKLPRKTILRYSLTGIAAFVVLSVIAFTPDNKELTDREIEHTEWTAELAAREVSSDKLANEIVNNYEQINVIDVRIPDEFKAYHIPLSINIPLEHLRDRQWAFLFEQKIKVNYFYAGDEALSRKAFLLANHLGKSDNYVLKDPVQVFQQLYTQITPPSEMAGKQEVDTYNFRIKAAKEMDALNELLKNSSEPVKPAVTKIKGGCS